MHKLHVTKSMLLGLGLTAAGAAAQDLVAALQADADLSSLLSAISAVPGLADTLDAAENITIFAPVNSAFADVDAESPEGLAISGGDVPGIQSILSYHVVPATIPSSAITITPTFVQTLLTSENLIAGGPATLTPGGQYLGAQLAGSDVVLSSGNLATSLVTQADIVVGGATIHKINKVLTLPTNASTTAASAGLTSIADAVTSSGLGGLFDAAPGITAFIPTNGALDNISSVVEQLSVRQLQSVLLLHLVAGATVFSTDIPPGPSNVTSALGEVILLNNNSTGIYVDQSQVVAPDVILFNGVAHVISSVLIPATLDTASLVTCP